MTNASQQLGWEIWGSELKNRREAAGLRQEEMARELFASRTLISRFESAERRPRLDMAIQIDGLLQTGGFFERLCRKLLEESPYESYFAPVAELEAVATKICDFETTLVPGLLQTAAFAHAVMAEADPFASDEVLVKRVAARLERARLFKSRTRPEYWAIVHEHALRIPVGGAACMAGQLDHIAALVRSRQVLIQVIPYTQGAHAAMTHSMKLMEFPDEPPTVYTEGMFWGQLLDDPAMVKRATATYDLLRAAALSPEASLTLIESAAESYRST
ncbi:helix-turn-helix transcriptional regulator [Streptomyces sp. NPDC048637]|uniref:helix-turn-helix domain-containing protein n=1 Tax=Streptomyces sp. NPDC048637 TaxID=3155636 RepID=UPI00341D0120